MSVVVTQFPSVNAAETTGLTNPNNAHADDGVYASCAPGKNVTVSTKYQNFGFDLLIPSNAVISKVQIIYQYKTSTTSSIATGRTYYKISGSAGSNNDDTAEPAADTTITVNVTAARAWTRADLLNGTLEVVLAGVQGNSGTAVTFSFDFVQVEVTFDALTSESAPTSPGVSETGSITKAESAPSTETTSETGSIVSSESSPSSETPSNAGTLTNSESSPNAEITSEYGVLISSESAPLVETTLESESSCLADAVADPTIIQLGLIDSHENGAGQDSNSCEIVGEPPSPPVNVGGIGGGAYIQQNQRNPFYEQQLAMEAQIKREDVELSSIIQVIALCR